MPVFCFIRRAINNLHTFGNWSHNQAITAFKRWQFAPFLCLLFVVLFVALCCYCFWPSLLDDNSRKLVPFFRSSSRNVSWCLVMQKHDENHHNKDTKGVLSGFGFFYRRPTHIFANDISQKRKTNLCPNVVSCQHRNPRCQCPVESQPRLENGIDFCIATPPSSTIFFLQTS